MLKVINVNVKVINTDRMYRGETHAQIRVINAKEETKKHDVNEEIKKASHVIQKKKNSDFLSKI